jgi:hypothetical protein
VKLSLRVSCGWQDGHHFPTNKKEGISFPVSDPASVTMSARLVPDMTGASNNQARPVIGERSVYHVDVAIMLQKEVYIIDTLE